MKKEVKGLFIVALILTSIVSSSFAFNEQSNIDSTSSNYGEGVLADTTDFKFTLPKDGESYFADCFDDNPVINQKTVYDFSSANDPELIGKINAKIREKSLENKSFEGYEIVKFDFTPIDSDYFTVTSDGNNVFNVVQKQDMHDNDQVMFLSAKLIIRNNETNKEMCVPVITYIADKNPENENINKKILNINQSPVATVHDEKTVAKDDINVDFPIVNGNAALCDGVICPIMGFTLSYAGYLLCLGACVTTGFACFLCGVIWAAATGLGVYDCHEICMRNT